MGSRPGCENCAVTAASSPADAPAVRWIGVGGSRPNHHLWGRAAASSFAVAVPSTVRREVGDAGCNSFCRGRGKGDAWAAVPTVASACCGGKNMLGPGRPPHRVPLPFGGGGGRRCPFLCRCLRPIEAAVEWLMPRCAGGEGGLPPAPAAATLCYQQPYELAGQSSPGMKVGSRHCFCRSSACERERPPLLRLPYSEEWVTAVVQPFLLSWILKGPSIAAAPAVCRRSCIGFASGWLLQRFLLSFGAEGARLSQSLQVSTRAGRAVASP